MRSMTKNEDNRSKLIVVGIIIGDIRNVNIGINLTLKSGLGLDNIRD